MWTQYSLNQYTNKLSVYSVGDYNVQKNPPLTLIMSLTKTIQSSYLISFKHWHLHYPPKSPKWFFLFRFSKQTLLPSSLHKTPNFTPTRYERNNFSFIDEYMQHSERNGSKYCLKLSCSFFQDHEPSQLLSRLSISYTRLTTKWQWYFTSNVTINRNYSRLRIYRKYCSKSILHSPSVSRIQITREARNSEYLLNVNNTQHRDKLNSGSEVITLSAIGPWLSFPATSVTSDILSFKTSHPICTMKRR